MILKYLLPFNRFVIECDMEPGEALARIEADTTAMALFRWNASDVPLERTIYADGFRVTTATAPIDFFGFNRTLNLFRALAIGRFVPASSGCRIVVHLRPLNETLIFFVFLAILFMPLLSSDMETSFEFVWIIPVWGLFYLLLTGGFWMMMPGIKRTLMHVLNGLPA